MSSPPTTNKQFLADETRFQGRYGRTLRDTLYQAYRPALPRTVFYLVIGLLGRIALLGNANLVGYWVDSLCRAPEGCRPLPSLLRDYQTQDFVTLLFAANIVGFVFTLAFRAGLSRLSAEAVSRIYDETTMRTSRLPMSFFDQNPSGRVMTRFTSDYNSIFRIFGGPIAEFITLVFDLLAMSILITVASPWLLPFWILQGAINFGVYRWFLPRLRKERRELALKRSPAIAHFAESANGANTIRAFERESVFQQRFARLNDNFLEQRKKTVTLFTRFSFAMGVGTSMAFLITGLACYGLATSGMLGVGAVGVAFAYLGLSSGILQNFFDWLGQFEEAMTGMERMNEYLRLPLEPGAKLPVAATFRTGQPSETPSESKRRSTFRVSAQAGVPVHIHDLWLRYRHDLPPVLKGITVEIRAGERLAVVGKTGSGKTSLVQALFRLYPIERGSIHVAGVEAETDGALSQMLDNRVNLFSYRSLLAYITQEPTLFIGTLRENLLAPGAKPVKEKSAPHAHNGDGLPVHTEEEIIEALRRVQFLRDGATKEEYKYWLDYQVEERGRNLSSGERQLICMARCLLQDSPVVILDEATSAVDPRSEEILTRANDEFFKGKTQILIAHRLSTVRSCDRILWLQDGQVHRLGTPAEVLPEFEGAELRV